MPRPGSRTTLTGTFTALALAGFAAVALAAPAQTRPSTRGVREQVEDERFQRELLGDGPPADTGQIVRSLMGESAKRLAASDPGEGTQYVQEQVVEGIDRLIQELSRRPAAASPKGQGGGKEQEAPGKASPAPAPGKSAGETAGGNAGGTENVSPAEDFRSAAETWGRISPKLRGPVVEGRSERVIGKYKSLVDDYYRAVSAKAAE